MSHPGPDPRYAGPQYTGQPPAGPPYTGQPPAGPQYTGQPPAGPQYTGQPPAAPPYTAEQPYGERPYGERPSGHRDVGGVSVGELIGDVTRDLSTLMRQELALAQAELKQEAAKTAKGAGALGGAGFAGYFVLLFLSIALWSGLSNVMDAGWAGLLVALLWAVIAAVLAVVGRNQLRAVHPKPERTVDTLSHVPDALRGRADQHRGGTA